MYTKFLRSEDIKNRWFVVDAKDLVLGRLSSILSLYLRGKHKPTYTPHVPCGDCIVVVNAEKVCLTGNKDKIFYWHTGYPGGIKQRSMKQTLSSKYPERVIIKAVERMIPRGPLGRRIMKNLKVYAGPDHPHQAQLPEMLNIKGMNDKNMRKAC